MDTHQPEKREKVRLCVGCRRLRRKEDMIRIIRTPEGEVLIDRTGKKNGRGAYLCADEPDCLTKAVKRKALEKSLKVAIPESLAVSLMSEFEMTAPASERTKEE